MINLNNLLNNILNSINHKENKFFTKKYSTFFLEKVYFVLEHLKNKCFLKLNSKNLEKYFDIMNYLVLIDMSMGNNNYYIVNAMLNFNDDEINMILNNSHDKLYIYNYICAYKLLKNADNITDIDDMEKYYLKKKKHYLSLLSNKKIDSIHSILEELSLDEFKEAFFYLVYGLDYDQTQYIVNTFQKYVDELKDDIDITDCINYNTLLDIINISSNKFLSSSDLSNSLCKRLKKCLLLDNQFKYTNFYYLTLKFKKMYMKAYNKHFTKIEDCKKVKIFSNVDTYLPNDNFFMAVHAVNKSASYMDSLDDYENDHIDFSIKSKTAISTSIVGPSNTGLLLSSLYIGYDNFSLDSIETLSPFDAFTSNKTISYFSDYFGFSHNNYFVPPSKIEDETRYGYNEMFNYGNIKPSYIVYMNGIDNLSCDINVKKVAEKLDVPIIVLDIYKIHLNEILKIKKMEDLLFDENNLSLIKVIICKYMNLISGSIVSANDFDRMKPQYFGIKELKNFLIKFNLKIDSLTDEAEKNSWLYKLEEAYNEEYEKNKIARNIMQYQPLLSTFVLDDSRYIDMKKYLINKHKEIEMKQDISNKTK